jgi:desulfoferrodoxin (superoxide reductase-like protein)
LRDPVTENLTRKCYHIATGNTNNIYLAPGQAPKAVFELGGEKPVAVYAYCNLHGLWMTKL